MFIARLARVLGAALAVVALSGRARAADPKPPQQLDDLKPLLGNWKCAGRQLAHAELGAEHVVAATLQVKPEADGFWRAFTYEEKKGKDGRGLKVFGVMGWDAQAKRFTRTAFSSVGTSETAISTGWTGQTMVWTGEIVGPTSRYPYRVVFTKRSDKEISQVVELNSSGLWSPFSDVHCNR